MAATLSKIISLSIEQKHVHSGGLELYHDLHAAATTLVLMRCLTAVQVEGLVLFCDQ